MPAPRSLPIIDQPPPRRRRSDRAIVVHAARMLVLAMLVLGLHRQAVRLTNQTSATELIDYLLRYQSMVPGAASFRLADNLPQTAVALDEHGQSIAHLMATSPHADKIIGYSGPTRMLVLMDEAGMVSSVKVVESFDTAEHLAQVKNDPAFWNQFRGLRRGEVVPAHLDGVSGATLTSLAIAESVAVCLREAKQSDEPELRQSLKFPDPISSDEMEEWLTPEMLAGQSMTIRTGQLSDTVIGYQGPSELLMLIDEDKLIDVRIRRSFDNEPYVDYVKQERSFWKKFKGRPLSDLAVIDLAAEQIDGVSGATMTSIAVAETIRDATGQWLALHAAETKQIDTPEFDSVTAPRWNFSLGEIFTGLLSIATIFWSFSSLRGDRRVRLVWQATSFVILVMLSGNLLSIALASGWTRGGPPIHFAPGLALLAAVTITMPIFSKRNVYCDQVCPHGAIQQWLRPFAIRNRLHRSKWITRFLHHPAVLLTLAATAGLAIAIGAVSLVKPPGVNLAWLEPFDAYLIGIGFSISGLVWMASIAASSVSPMYYCRHACPTGKLLGYLRRDGRSDSLRWADLLVLAGCVRVWL